MMKEKSKILKTEKLLLMFSVKKNLNIIEQFVENHGQNSEITGPCQL